jgi:hypothetical protein
MVRIGPRGVDLGTAIAAGIVFSLAGVVAAAVYGRTRSDRRR